MALEQHLWIAKGLVRAGHGFAAQDASSPQRP